MKKVVAFLLCAVIGIGLALAWTYFMPSSSNNIELRAALDVGSGTTNMKIAKVDRSTDKIISVIFQQTIPVAYQKELEQSSDNTFNRSIMDKGIKAISELKAIADSYHVKKLVAVATAAFRYAKNANSFIDEIQQRTGVKVKVISQDEEGYLAFRSALATSPISSDDVVVWDIGGGSLQLTYQNGEDNYIVNKGTVASAAFKNVIIEKIEGKDPTKVHTPNPMTGQQMDQAIQYAAKLALTNEAASTALKAKIADKKTKVLAVGSLFNYSIRPMVNNQADITRDQLTKVVYQLQGLPDEKLSQDAFADVIVSNPLLVLGYMNALNIEQVTILNVNNTDGALTYEPLWQS